MSALLAYEDFHAGQMFALGSHVLTESEMIDFAAEFDSAGCRY